MNRLNLFIIGIAIMFGQLPGQMAFPPTPQAQASDVLFREGDPVEVAQPEPPPPPPPPPIAKVEKTAVVDVKEIQQAVEKIVKQADEPELAPEWVQSVYEVRVTGTSTDPATWGRRATGGGTAVAVGPAKLHTAKHLTERLNGYVVEVQVNGEWRQATFSGVPGKDLAVLTLAGTAALPAVKVRPPEYGERVTVYGLATKSFAQGTYTGDHNPAIGDGLIPLDKGQTAVEQGDSGGGAFGDDGCLLGTITGRRQEVHEVTAIVPIVADAHKAPAVQAAETGGAARTPPPARAVQSCPGGVCQQQFTPQTGKRRGRWH